ncbi:hypothetical protein KJ713_01755 [Patescibacteria group bacterium]|nr:hypothetical protein [Patescibacteria group bacterium]
MTIVEAIQKIKNKKSAKFNESIEAHFKLKPIKEAKKDLKFLFKMPHQYGDNLPPASPARSPSLCSGISGREAKQWRAGAIVALTSKVEAAKKAGAKYAGGEDIIEKIKKIKIEFDIIVAEPKMMQLLKPLAKDLGRAGKMPTDKSGTLTNDVAGTVKKIKEGRREIRSDEFGGIHLMVGKMDTKDAEIEENIEEIKKAIASHRPIESMTLCSTMGKAVKVDLNS